MAEVPLRAPALTPSLESADYIIQFPAAALAMPAEDFAARLEEFGRAETFVTEFVGRNKTIQRDLKQSVLAANVASTGDQVVCAVTINMREQFYVNPVSAIEHIVEGLSLAESAHITRTKLRADITPAVQVA